MQNNALYLLQYTTKLICLGVMQLLKENSAQYRALIFFDRRKRFLKKKYHKTNKLEVSTESCLHNFHIQGKK